MGENIRKELQHMTQNYTPKFRKKIVRLHEEEGQTYKSIVVVSYSIRFAMLCTSWVRTYPSTRPCLKNVIASSK